MRNYRAAFILTLIGNIALIALAAFLWLHYRGSTSSQADSQSTASSASAPPPTTVATEAPLAPIQLSPERLQSIGVKTGEVEWRNVEDDIQTTGTVTVDETGVAYVQLRFSGYIQKVFADATYQYVRKGQPLFTIYSPELVSTEREYLVAKQNQTQVAGSTVPGVASSSDSLVQAAADRLKQWGVPEKEISRLESTRQVQQELEIDSSVSGYITEREALPNKYVQPDTRLYTVADLSTVWVFAQVFQNDLGRVKSGAMANLAVDTYPGRTFPGRIDFIYPDVDPTTRTARVRLIFPNPDLKLTPGMFVGVALKLPMGRQIAIPASGVLQSGTRQIAFVDHGNGSLEPRDVQLGARAGDDFIVLKGLKPGERIVTSANFLIDSESQLQAALGSFAPPPPGVGAASTANAPQANLELVTEPSPPRNGTNLFRVKMTDAGGSAISGAQVNVTFFMPAMPAMGMAAMRTSVDLADKGNGAYEGSGDLGSGGTWQVTIVAKKNGQTIGTKQFSVNATGGM